MALHDYLAGEVGEDWADGIISRREALRRLALLGLSVGSASRFSRRVRRPVAREPRRPTSASVRTSRRRAASPSRLRAVGLPGRLPPTAKRSRSPARRAELQGFFAAAGTPKGAMLVIHENRGLNDHIRSVASRLAADGYSALAIDLLSEEGGSDALAQGDVQAALSQASTERLVGDMKAGLDELARRAPGAKLGAIGFCFGGGMVWALLDAGDRAARGRDPVLRPGARRARLLAATRPPSSVSTPSTTTASTRRAQPPRRRSPPPGSSTRSRSIRASTTRSSTTPAPATTPSRPRPPTPTSSPGWGATWAERRGDATIYPDCAPRERWRSSSGC